MLILALTLFLAAPFAMADNPARTQALAALEAGEAERAIEILERAIRTDRNNAVLHFMLGNAEAGALNSRSTIGQMRAAGRMRRAWERAVELDPSHVQARFALMSYYSQAPGIAGGDKGKAREQQQAIARLDPVQGHRAHATIHAMDGELAEAVIEITRAAVLSKDDPEVHATIQGERGFMCQRAEDWACAHDAFTAAVKGKEDYWMGWYQIGRTALLSEAHLDEGAAALERYTGHTPRRNEPSIAWARTRLGQLYLKQERVADAREQFTTALTLEPDHEEAKRALAGCSC